jgi:ribosomal protein S24E
MSLIETVSDVNNTFLSRRELTCNFAGLGGKLKKLEAIDMISKEFKLDGKVIIPMKLQTHVGKPLITGTFYVYDDEKLITGTFYVYDDEKLAKEHVNPAIFSRLEKAKNPAEETPAKEKPEVKAEDPGEVKKEEPSKEVKVEEKPQETPKEAKVEEEKPKESE